MVIKLIETETEVKSQRWAVCESLSLSLCVCVCVESNSQQRDDKSASIDSFSSSSSLRRPLSLSLFPSSGLSQHTGAYLTKAYAHNLPVSCFVSSRLLQSLLMGRFLWYLSVSFTNTYPANIRWEFKHANTHPPAHCSPPAPSFCSSLRLFLSLSLPLSLAAAPWSRDLFSIHFPPPPSTSPLHLSPSLSILPPPLHCHSLYVFSRWLCFLSLKLCSLSFSFPSPFLISAPFSSHSMEVGRWRGRGDSRRRVCGDAVCVCVC